MSDDSKPAEPDEPDEPDADEPASNEPDEPDERDEPPGPPYREFERVAETPPDVPVAAASAPRMPPPALLDPPAVGTRFSAVATLRRDARWIVLGLLVGLLAGYLAALLTPRTYVAEASIYLQAIAPFSPAETDPATDPVRFVADQAELAVTGAILNSAGASLDPPLTLEETRPRVTAVPSSESNRVIVSATGDTPEQAAALANLVLDGYRTAATERVKSATDEALGIDADTEFRRNVQLRSAAYGDGIADVEQADEPTSAASPRPLQYLVVGGLLGAFVVAAWSAVRGANRAHRVTIAELDELFGGPLLTRTVGPASAATDDVLGAGSRAHSVAAHEVLIAIDVALEGNTAQSVGFFTWQRALTTTALTVGTACAAHRGGRAVVIVDGGLKDHGVTAVAEVDPAAGIAALADPETPVDRAVRRWPLGRGIAGDPDLDRAAPADGEPAGKPATPTPAGSFRDLLVVPVDDWSPYTSTVAARPEMLRRAIHRLHRDGTDLVLVDAPPLTERSLGLALGRGVDRVVLVVDESTTIEDAREMARQVRAAGVTVLGYVLATEPARPSGLAGGLSRLTGRGSTDRLEGTSHLSGSGGR